MSRVRHRIAVTVGLIAIALAGCGGDDEVAAPPATTLTPATTVESTPAPPPPTTTTVATPALPGLATADADLIAGYPAWTELTTPPQASLRSLGEGAHRGDKRIWASPDSGVDSGTQSFPYPRGSVVIKEARSGGDITLIAIMEKVRANDAATGGWRYVEYTRSGGDDDFAKVNFPESGCAGCHMSANTTQKTDWVFFSK